MEGALTSKMGKQEACWRGARLEPQSLWHSCCRLLIRGLCTA